MAATATQLDTIPAAAQAADGLARLTGSTLTITVITTTLLTGGAGRRGLR
jgi:hypothetical protein